MSDFYEKVFAWKIKHMPEMNYRLVDTGGEGGISHRKQWPAYHHAMGKDLIIVDPRIQGGVPVFAGTRVPVKNLFDYLETGECLDQFLDDFPSVARDVAVAVLEQAREAVTPHAHSA